jgi:transposase
MFHFFGGTPKLLVPDNLKSGVNKASFYDPEINRTYSALASHYGVGVLPARPRKPRDKAKVEAGVRFAQSYILGRLRRQTFFSLAECNAAIALAMEAMNSRTMRKLGVSRRELFDKIEREALSPLPEADWEYAEWKRARVNIDYHVEVDGFFYSVPHTLIHAEVDVGVTARMIEIFYRGQRIGLHERRAMGRRHGTDPDHMPSSHRRYAAWTPARFLRWAAKIGPNTEGLVAAVLASRRHPEQGFRTCLGVLQLHRGVDPARAEAVSARALEIDAFNCKSVSSLLARKPAAATRDGGAIRARQSTRPRLLPLRRNASCLLIRHSIN